MSDKGTGNAPLGAVIKVIGVGGGGGNAINSMISSGITGVEFVAANTDVQSLQNNLASIKIQLGRELTKGLGAGANPDIGRDAALEDKAIIQEVLSGADMVFVTAGMGGGTGTGAAPIIAQVARELGALTLGVVTKPFAFEGRKRKAQCEHGIQSLKAAVDTLITIPNQRLLSIAPPNMTMLESFKLADEVLVNAVRGISDIININGHINVDFADVKKIMSNMGMALMGIGTATGSGRAAEAARAAISSPLLEDVDIEGATGLLINITSSRNVTLQEVNEACTLIQESAHEEAEVIFGQAFDDSLGEAIRITVIATGFDQANIALPVDAGVFRSYPQVPGMGQGGHGGMGHGTHGHQSHHPMQGGGMGQHGMNGHSQGMPSRQGGGMGSIASVPGTTFSGEARHSQHTQHTQQPGVGLQNVPRGTQQNNASHMGAQGNGYPQIPLRQPHEVGQPSYRNNAGAPAGGAGSYENDRARGAQSSGNVPPGGMPAPTNAMSTLGNQNRQMGEARQPFGTTVQPLGAHAHQIAQQLQGHGAQATGSRFDGLSAEALARAKSEAEELTAWTLQNRASEGTVEDAERSLSGASLLAGSHDDEKKATETALSLAEELSSVEIDDTDFETPAYLRRRDEPSKNA